MIPYVSAEGFGCGIGTTKLIEPLTPGTHCNLFLNYTFPCEGYLTKMVYSAEAVGNFYLGIWKASGNGYILLRKMKISSTKRGIQVRERSFSVAIVTNVTLLCSKVSRYGKCSSLRQVFAAHEGSFPL